MFFLHFCDCSLSFSCEIKTVVHSCISLTSQKPLMGAMANFVQWYGLIFVFSITLTVIFKWFIKVER